MTYFQNSFAFVRSAGLFASNGAGAYKVRASISVPNPKGILNLTSTSTVVYDVVGPGVLPVD